MGGGESNRPGVCELKRGFCKSHAEFPHKDDFLSNRYWIHSRSGTTVKKKPTAVIRQKKHCEQRSKSRPSEHLWRLIGEELQPQPKKRETARKKVEPNLRRKNFSESR